MTPRRAWWIATLAVLALPCGAAVPPGAPDAPASTASAASAAIDGRRFRITPTLLKSALAHDAGLGNVLAQFLWQGVALSRNGGTPQGRLMFVPRPAAALGTFIDDPSTPFPKPPATGAANSRAVYWLEPTGEGGHRLRLGIADALAPPAEAAWAANRWFELTVVAGADELTALSWRSLPPP